MQSVNFRGAVTAAAVLFVTLFGAEPSAALAQEQAVAAAAVTAPQSGSTWIAEGTAAQPAPTATVSPQTATPHIQADSLQELVGDMPVETDLTPDLKCLATAVYFESRGEPLDGQLAVAEVIINRASSGHYPTSYCDVVTQPAQFSFVHHGHLPTADESSQAWRRAKAVAQIAQQNLWESKAANAMFFHATYVKPSWARQKVELAQIETHIFYR